MLLISTASSPQTPYPIMMKRPLKKTPTAKTTKAPSSSDRTKKPAKKATASTSSQSTQPAKKPATAATTPPVTKSAQKMPWYDNKWIKWSAITLVALFTVVSLYKVVKYYYVSSTPVPSISHDSSTPASPANENAATTPPPTTPPVPPSFTSPQPPLSPLRNESSSTNITNSSTTNVTTIKEIPVFIPVTNYVPVMNTNAGAASFVINAGNNGIVTHFGGQTVIANSVMIEAPAVPIAPIQADSKYVNVNVGQKTVTIPSGKIALIRPLGVKVQEIGGLPPSVRKMIDGMTPDEAVNTVVPSVIEYYYHGSETVEIKLKWGN